MNIIVIVYRPDHTDSCRGCIMGSTASDMALSVFDNIEDAADFLALYMKENEVRDRHSFAEYEFSYVINGVDGEDVEGDDYKVRYELETMARAFADVSVKIYNEAEAARKVKVETERKERERQQELATLARLQEKHNK